MKSVDVIIPLYNGAPWIKETIDSVLAQTLKPSKIIVVNDSSSDDSVKHVYNQPEILLLSNPGKGAEMARNFGLKHCDSEYVVFLDQDDLWHPDHLKLMIGTLSQFPQAVAAISKISYFIDKKESPKFDINNSSFMLWNPWESYPSFYEQHTPCGMVFLSSKFKEMEGWALDQAGNSDYFALYQISMDNPIVKHNAITAAYRIHDESWTTNINKDFPGLILSSVKSVNDLMEIYLMREADQNKKLHVRYRNSFSLSFFSLLINFYNKNYKLLYKDIPVLEAFLKNETPHFKDFIKHDLYYFIEIMAMNKSSNAKKYLNELLYICPDNVEILRNMILNLLDIPALGARYYLTRYFRKFWSISYFIDFIRALKRRFWNVKLSFK